MATLKRKSPKSNAASSKVVSGILQEGAEVEARLVYVADLGLQDQSKYDKPPVQQIALGFEVIGEAVKLDNGEEKPKVMWSRAINVYHELTEKGVELEFYKIFDSTAKKGEVADWEKVLGSPCSITVGHNSKDGVTYDNIAGIAPIPKKYQDKVGAATIEPCIGDSEDEENACTKALFGLVKYIWGKRIVDDEGYEGNVESEPYGDGDVPF